MIQMNRFCGVQVFGTGVLAVALLSAASCSRSVDVPTEEGSSPTGQTPFHDDAPQASSTALADYYPSSDGKTSSPSLPFHDSQSLPAGTLLVVRLKDPVFAGRSVAQESFEGSLDEAIVINGNTLIPRGAAVTGRVESVRASSLNPNRGYLRLALQSVHVAGVDVPVQTASLFVRQSLRDDASGSPIHIDEGRQLTFRLREPVNATTGVGSIAR